MKTITKVVTITYDDSDPQTLNEETISHNMTAAILDMAGKMQMSHIGVKVAHDSSNKLAETISDTELDAAWAYANFGSTPKREVLRNTLLKCASGYHSGWTATCIVRELGLVHASKWALTKKGKEYLFDAYSKGLSV